MPHPSWYPPFAGGTGGICAKADPVATAKSIKTNATFFIAFLLPFSYIHFRGNCSSPLPQPRAASHPAKSSVKQPLFFLS
jgi:hypothetical protein